MKKTPDINPKSQDVAELQAMVKALMASENQWKQERQSLLEQLKLAFDRQFAKRSEALKPYDESQGDLFNEVECEAAKEEEVEVVTTTMKNSVHAANIVCIKSVKTAVRNLSSHQLCSKCWNMFVLNMLVVSVSKLKTTATSFKNQRLRASSLKASRQKAY